MTNYRTIRTALVNDTSGTSNPGCQGTVHGLISEAEKRGFEIRTRLPVGYEYPRFGKCFLGPPTPSLAERFVRRLAPDRSAEPKITTSPALCPDHWHKHVQQLQSRLEPVWQDIDLVLINGEGTIHHNTVGAATLMGICTAARNLGKKVALVNCSIFELNAFLLDALRKSVDFLSVREPFTLRYLQSQDIAAVPSADFLFLAAGEPGSNVKVAGINESRYLIYTPGVLSMHGQAAAEVVYDDIHRLVKKGTPVYYYVVEMEDENLAGPAVDAGAQILPLGSLQRNQVMAVLKASEGLISGRYHMNIYAALSGIPFRPLQTNTMKMEGLLELLDCATSVVRIFDAPDNPTPVDEMAFCLPDRLDLDRCRHLAEQSLDQMASCLFTAGAHTSE